MAVDPRTPVLIGAGQVNQRDDDETVDPVELMVSAAREAAPARVLESVDSVRVISTLSWRYRDAGLLVGQRIGASDVATSYSSVGGNMPQALLSRACLDIQQGTADVVLLTGAEAWRTKMRLRGQDRKPDWPSQDHDDIPLAPIAGDDVAMGGPAELRVELIRPSHVYPLFEQALRIANGETSDDHRRRVGALWSQFSAVAAGNPHAWSQTALTADEIWQPSSDNRMISWPYTKLMNSNNMVNQGAAVILTSAAAATKLDISTDRWVFPHSGADAQDTVAIAERAELHRSVAIRFAGQRALELAGVGVDDIAHVDLYSCFPSAVQVAATELGFPLGDPHRLLTVTGGLTFGGGPWNNYVTHAIATMYDRLVANPGDLGLITANGGVLTKHSIGVYGTAPHADGFRWDSVQCRVDSEPTHRADVQWTGVGTVESWTTPFDRDGNPEKCYLVVRVSDDVRTVAVDTDPADLAASVRDDLAGAAVHVDPDGTARLA